jgi:lipoprotein LprG
VRACGRLIGFVLAVVTVASCGSSSTSAPDPAQLLRDAKTAIDSASSVHFTITSQNVSGPGPLLTGGDGNAVRPSSFAGKLAVVYAGFPVSIDVVSIGGSFWVATPLTAGRYEVAKPSDYGFGDPGVLLDPTRGLSSLLTACTGATMRDGDRLNGEQLDEVSCSVSGDRVASLLTSADPSAAVHATVGMVPGGHQLRRVVMVGPFFEKGKDSTFSVVLDKYGTNVTITPPAQ